MKTNLKRILSILCVAALLLTTVVACQKTESDSDSASNSDSDSSEESSEPTLVTMIAVGGGMPSNYDAWQTQVNDYLTENYNLQVDIEIVAWADWDSRRSVIVNTGAEGYDIVFTNNNTFLSDVSLGVFADISDLLEDNIPGILEMSPDYIWEAVSVNDGIYGVPTYKDISSTRYVVYDEAMLDAVDMWEEAAAAYEFADLTPIVTAISEYIDGPAFIMNQNSAGFTEHYTLERLVTNEMPIVYDQTTGLVGNLLESDIIVEQLTIAHEWYTAGIINSDAAVAAEVQDYSPVKIASGWSTAADTVWGPQMNCEAVAYQLGDTTVSTSSILGSINCITSGSSNKEAALQLLDAINTDVYVRDLFSYGVEGDNWDYTDDGESVHKNNTDWTMAAYTQGTFFTITPTDDTEINQWDEVRELNENANASDLLGFTFDSTGLEDQIANCTEIWGRWQSEVSTGTIDPAVNLPTIIAELEASGLQDVIDAAQEQVDAFLATK